jgi:hypothetical protein
VGKPPSGIPRKKRRGSRGRRVGRARGRQPRCRRTDALDSSKVYGTGELASVSKTVQLGGRSGYLRRRRREWLERRFQLVERLVELDPIPGEGMRFAVPSRSRFGGALRSLNWCLTSKKVPFPPGKNLNDWFRAYMEMKHGTWSWVSAPLQDSVGEIRPPGVSAVASYYRPVATTAPLPPEQDQVVEGLSSRERVRLNRELARGARNERRPRPLLRDEDGRVLSRREATELRAAMRAKFSPSEPTRPKGNGSYRQR